MLLLFCILLWTCQRMQVLTGELCCKNSILHYFFLKPRTSEIYYQFPVLGTLFLFFFFYKASSKILEFFLHEHQVTPSVRPKTSTLTHTSAEHPYISFLLLFLNNRPVPLELRLMGLFDKLFCLLKLCLLYFIILSLLGTFVI